ncbi:MAG: hypothetical protein AB7S74_09655 [Hyphomicrobium sp.]
MGSEELRKRRRSHDKYIDKKRVELATPDLFTQTPRDQPRCALASIFNGSHVSEGDTLVIEVADRKLLGKLGNSIVATFDQPPADILAAIECSSSGLAMGTIIKVNALSKTVEVSIR